MLDDKTIKAIESVLAKDERVELIPTLDETEKVTEVKVIRVIRKAVKK